MGHGVLSPIRSVLTIRPHPVRCGVLSVRTRDQRIYDLETYATALRMAGRCEVSIIVCEIHAWE